MKNKIRTIITTMVLPLIVVVLTISCSDDEAITYSMTDASDRITGLSSTAPGQGSNLTISGTQLGDVVRVFVGNEVVTDENFVSQDESSITLVVPAGSALGENELLVVWPGSARGTALIDVVLFHTVSSIAPLAASAGQTVTLFGNNLDLVEEVTVGGDVTADIVNQSSGVLKFTMPSGASTGSVSISSSAGTFTSTGNLIACEAEPGDFGCLPVVNANGSFEESDLGEASGISGWGGLTGSLTTGIITDEEAYEGFHSVKVTINDIGANPWNIQPTSPFDVDLDEEYHLSFWVKGSGLASIKFAVDGDASGGYSEYGGSSTVEVNTGNEWEEISYNFTPTSSSGNNGTVRFAISMSYEGNVGGVIYMDNLRVVKVE